MDDLPTVQVESRRGGCHVNYKLLPIKGFYFAFLAAVGSLLPFLTIYMKSLGLTSSESGVLYGVMPFVGFFIRPVVGAIADRWSKHKLMLMICVFLTGVFYLLILTIPAREKPSLVVHSQLDCNIQDSFFRDCVSQPVTKSLNSHTCTVSLTEFAETVLASKNRSGYDESNLDCKAHCSHTEALDDMRICFSDEPGDFVKTCPGTVVSENPVAFHLRNMSHILNSEVKADRIDQNGVHCRDYDLKMMKWNEKLHWQLLCDEEATLTCKIYCENPPDELCQLHEKEYDAVYFWLFFITLFANLAFSPVFSLADAATFDLLRDKPERYGKQRMWGTVGFAIFAVTSTFTMYIMSQHGNQTNYTVSFCIFTALCCCAAVIAYFLNLSAGITCGGNMFHNFCSLMGHPQVLAFLVVVLYFGIATGVLEAFLFWFLLGLGAEPLVLGFCLVINCLFEVPLLFLSGLIIKRIGAVSCLYIALVALAVRMLGYSLLTNPWVVLVIEPLHGITFGIMWASATTHAAALAPAGMSATIQGLIGGVHFGIGKGIGSIVTGFMFDNLGPRLTFQVYSAITVGFLVLYVLLNQVVFRLSTQTPGQQPDRKRKDMENAENNGFPLLSTTSDSTDRQSDKDQPIDETGDGVKA